MCRPRPLAHPMFLLVLICAAAARADALPLAAKMLALPAPMNDIVWDPTRSRFFAISGTNVLLIDPETALIEDTIGIGEVADRIAVSDDGRYLYAAVGSRAVIKRYQVQNHAVELEIALGRNSSGLRFAAAAMVVLPGRPESVLVARGLWPAAGGDLAPMAGDELIVFDNAVKRSTTALARISSLYIRRSDRAVFGWGDKWGDNRVFWLSISDAGVLVTRSVPVTFSGEQLPLWDGDLVTGNGYVFDLNAANTIGALSASPVGACTVSANSSTRSVFTVESGPGATSLVRYSLADFRPAAKSDFAEKTAFCGAGRSWGTDGLAAYGLIGGQPRIMFCHTSGLEATALAPAPKPVHESSGIIRLPLAANGLAYDPKRNVIWASIPGNAGEVGNGVIAIDPGTGNILDSIYAGSEPGAVALSGDGDQLFVIIGGAPMVRPIDLNTRQGGTAFSVLDSIALNSQYWKANSIAAVPNTHDTVVVVRRPRAPSNSWDSSVVVYDGGAPRQQSFDQIGFTLPVGLSLVQAVFPSDSPDGFYAINRWYRDAGGMSDMFRLLVDQNGVHLDRQLRRMKLGNAAVPLAVVCDGGNLFTSGGERWTSDARQLLGSFAGQGVPIPLDDQNRIAYVQSEILTVFDLATFRPVGTISYRDSPLFAQTSAAVRAGRDAVAISVAGQTFIVPLSNMQPWPTYSAVPENIATGVRRLVVPVNAISGVPGSSKLLLATPSVAGDIGNSILILDPPSGRIETAVYMGSEPSVLAPSADGSVVYTLLAGEARIGRLNVGAGSRDLVFAPDPPGISIQYAVFDIAASPDGGLAVSYDGGWIATFDDGTPRPVMDQNVQGTFAYTPATFRLAFNDSGSRLYAYNTYLSTFEMKRCSVSSDGIRWLSSTDGLIAGYDVSLQYAQGLLYTSRGTVIDPERSRVIGQLALPSRVINHVVADLAAGRLYAVAGSQVAIFDAHTYALLGSMDLNFKSYTTTVRGLVRFGDNGLALNTSDGQVFLVEISAIPLLPAPVPSPQPSLPATPGVTLIDLKAQDLACDVSRSLLYATIPNSEGALGDRIAVINAETGDLVESYIAGPEPRLLALSSDRSQLHFTSGYIGNWIYNGFSFGSEGVRTMDLASRTIGPAFAVLPAGTGFSHWIGGLAALPGEPGSVAVMHGLSQDVVLPSGASVRVNSFESVRVYDNGSPRPVYIQSPALGWRWMQPGATSGRLYCASEGRFSTLTVDSSGVAIQSTSDLSQNGVPMYMLYAGGRVYTTTGLVIDPEVPRVVANMEARGPVAVDGSLVYWLDPGTSDPARPSITLRSFDTATLQPGAERVINVTSPYAGRLVRCGQGRLAFNAGREIYIVHPTMKSRPLGIGRPAPPGQRR